ncbi:MAG: hypothetical protein ACK40G_14345 [Cytophagaceae bacterium]
MYIKAVREPKANVCPVCGEEYDNKDWGMALKHEHRGMTHPKWMKSKVCQTNDIKDVRPQAMRNL